MLLLRNFVGDIVQTLSVSTESVKLEGEAKSPPKHLILLADASGSMWGDMPSMRQILQKICTLAEYSGEQVYLSLLSYADRGDLRVHFAHVSAAVVGGYNSPQIQQIEALQARGCTCISQALKAVKGILQPGEATAAVLVSDGYANDASPSSESRCIDEALRELGDLPVVLSTVALRMSSDFLMLSRIAAALGGQCFAVPSVRELYDAVYATASSLVGGGQAVVLPLNGATMGVAVSRSARRVQGFTSDLTLRGMKPTDDLTVYRFSPCPAPTGQEVNAEVALAYAIANLAMGNVNQAKYALVSTKNVTMLSEHGRALTNEQLTTMQTAMQSALFDGFSPSSVFSAAYGMPDAGQTSVLEVIQVLASYPGALSLDVPTFSASYQRKGVQRIPGTRQGSEVIPPRVKVANRDASNFAKVTSFDLNRSTASANMTVARPVKLISAATEQEITEVAGVQLDLNSFNSYSLVSDGSLNVAVLPVRISDKRLHKALCAKGILPEGAFAATTVYQIRLEGRPLIRYDQGFDAAPLEGLFDRLAKLKTLSGFLSALQKGESEKYSAEQIQAFKEVHLSSTGGLSIPTTTPYADLQAALAEGSIDTRTSYKVEFGSRSIYSLSDLYSANEYLARRFQVVLNGETQKKPTCNMLGQPACVVSLKKLTGATKLNAVDALQFPLFESLLLDPEQKLVRDLLGVAIDLKNMESIIALRQQLDAEIETQFASAVSPIVFYIGSTGLVPDDFEAKGLTMEQVKAVCPELTFPKEASEGTFYLIGSSTLLTVYSRSEYYSR